MTGEKPGPLKLENGFGMALSVDAAGLAYEVRYRGENWLGGGIVSALCVRILFE